jgi:hypothetical protein
MKKPRLKMGIWEMDCDEKCDGCLYHSFVKPLTILTAPELVSRIGKMKEQISCRRDLTSRRNVCSLVVALETVGVVAEIGGEWYEVEQ